MADAAAGQQHAVAVPECTNEQEVIETYNRLRQEQSSYMSRIAQAEAERFEHALCAETLEAMEPSRQCHNLVGGVLVERTVGEVLPMIKQNIANFDLVLKNLGDALGKSEEVLNSFISKYKIRVRGAADPTPPPERSGNAA